MQVLDGVKPANTDPVRVDTTPGSIERYSGGGTTSMQQLLVDVTGKPFPALMQELVLGPAGMASSTYEQPLPAARAPEAARAHRQDGKPIPGGWHVYPEMAPAGLWTTPTDLVRWALAITDARAGRSTALPSQGMTQQMLTKQKDQVGLGPFVGGSGRNFHFGHGGANEGFHSELVMYPELGVGAAVMTNGDGGPMLIREVLRSLASEYGWPDYGAEQVPAVTLDVKTVAGLVGTYQRKVGPGIPARVEKDGDRLMLRAQAIPEQELVPKSDTSFVILVRLAGNVHPRGGASRDCDHGEYGVGGTIEGKRTKKPGARWRTALRCSPAHALLVDELDSSSSCGESRRRCGEHRRDALDLERTPSLSVLVHPTPNEPCQRRLGSSTHPRSPLHPVIARSP